MTSAPLVPVLLRAHASARLLTATALVVLVLGMLGCAAQNTYREGQRLLDQNRPEEGLLKMQEALELDPRSGEFRKGLALARERTVNALLDQAGRQQRPDQWPQAMALYRRVLEVSPGHDMARQALARLERQQRQDQLLQEARQALAAKDWTQARSALEASLRIDSAHAESLALQAELTRLTTPVAVDNGLSAFYRKPISIEFKEVPLRQAFEVLSRSSGLNFVFDKDVKTDQKTSIFLRDTTVESALHFMLLTNQLEQQVMNGNTLLIYPNTPAKQKDYQELSVRTFQMANTDVKSVAAALKTLFKGRDVVVDERQNMLVVRDTPEALRTVERLVALHDVAEPEVMLEVTVLEVTRNRLLELGVRWPDSLSLSPLASDNFNGLTLNDLKKLSGNTIGAVVGATKLNFRKEDNDVNILANPRIRVVNREKAKVLIGDRVPVITVTTSPQGGFAETINYVDVGLKLEVEPVIYRGSDVVIKVALEVSNISGQQTSKLGAVAYTFGTRTANTTLRLRDGENQVLAGLINDEDRRVANKVPGLGELPVLGRLFGSAQDEGKKSEIVLSITPRLVRNAPRPDGSLSEFRSGTESSPRERPDLGAPGAASPAMTPSPSLEGPRVVEPPREAPPVAAPLPAPPQPAPAALPSPVPMVRGESPILLAAKSSRIRVEEGDDAP